MFRRLSTCWSATCLLFALPAAGAGAEQEFPYQAQVVADQVEVRCGPGSGFYVTGSVNRSDSVTVHRHDHGGWFMIAPPRGSLSWIDADLVKRVGPERGIVEIEPVDGRPARAIVRIGSQISDDHSYYGRELSNGDEVRILGEETLETQRGPVRMLKIVPPAQEFRWIKGEFVVPSSEQLQQKQAADPYQLPPELRKFSASLERPQSFNRDRKPAGETLPAPKETIETPVRDERSTLFDQLDQVDQRYAAMMQLEPASWELEEVEQAYRQLHSRADAAVRALIDQRLQVVARRREIQGHYQQFIRVATETSRRDAQLQAMQTGYEGTPPGPPPLAPPSPPRLPAVQTPSPSPSPSPLPEEEEGGGAINPRLNGAGIIQPVNFFPGGPQFVLLAPDGRLLAYLEPSPGVSMGEWLGKASGIVGRRTFDPQLQADLIRVQKIVPVQLVPSRGRD